MAESAAHSLLVTPVVQDFFDELGVPLASIRPESKARYIMRDGKMRRMPLGPLEMMQLFLRALFLPAVSKLSPERMTLDQWTRRFLGQKALEYLIAPMVRGIYGVTPRELCVGAAFPPWVVPRYRSFLFHVFARFLSSRWPHSFFRKSRKSKAKMMAPEYGMGALIDALTLRLNQRLKDRLRLRSPVSELPKNGNIILAIPAYQASLLLQKEDPKLAQSLQKVNYAPLVSVTLFLRKESLAVIPRGVGVLFPPSESLFCLGILFNSSSFPNRVLDENQWISCTAMLGGSGQSEILGFSDEKYLEIIQKEFCRLFGYQSEMTNCKIYRWPQAIPIYDQGFFEIRSVAKDGWCSQPGHVLFGNYTGQVSIRGMIESAKEKFTSS
jgi:oxygen-dependent protoporphyrinogen oxidase